MCDEPQVIVAVWDDTGGRGIFPENEHFYVVCSDPECERTPVKVSIEAVIE